MFKSLRALFGGKTATSAAVVPGYWARAVDGKKMVAIADWFIGRFFWTGLIGLALAGLAAGLSGIDGLPGAAASLPNLHGTFNFALGLRVLALGLLLAGASGVVGWMFGLVFGVPRSAGETAAAAPPATAPAEGGAPAAPAAAAKVNPNLVEISDWLTKTLVGVGLTQLYNLPGFLNTLADGANQHGFVWGEYGHLLTLAIILYFLPGGFWLGYVGTRTFITRLFDQFASGLTGSAIGLARGTAMLELDSANRILPAKPDLRAIDAALLSLPLEALTSREEVAAWAAAQARAKNLDAARAALENVLSRDPADVEIVRQLVKVDLALGRFADASVLAKRLPDSPPKMIAALYESQPVGFTEALRIGEALVQTDDGKNSPSMHVWLACGYAQKYSWLHKQNPNDPALAAVRQRVLDEVKSAIDIDADTRAQLHSYWKPQNADTLDNDLEVFAPDDAQLTALLEPPAAAAVVVAAAPRAAAAHTIVAQEDQGGSDAAH